MSAKLQDAIERLILKESLKGTSLISTIYGDSLLHRGGNMSLSSLIHLMELFGFNERAVRTAVFRLVKKQWLVSEKIGRISDYRFTEESRERYFRAEQRIYNLQLREWDNYWSLVLLDHIETEQKTILKKELEWLGYASISTNMMAYPDGQDQQRLHYLFSRLQLIEQMMVFKSELLPNVASNVNQLIVEKNWQLNDIKERYLQYLEYFRDIYQLLKQERPNTQQAFQIRTLLIHYYRRIVLKDPNLPLELLPTDWPSINALSLTANIYKEIDELADEYFLSIAKTAEGSLPVYAFAFNRRFADLTLHAD